MEICLMTARLLCLVSGIPMRLIYEYAQVSQVESQARYFPSISYNMHTYIRTYSPRTGRRPSYQNRIKLSQRCSFAALRVPCPIPPRKRRSEGEKCLGHGKIGKTPYTYLPICRYVGRSGLVGWQLSASMLLVWPRQLQFCLQLTLGR